MPGFALYCLYPVHIYNTYKYIVLVFLELCSYNIIFVTFYNAVKQFIHIYQEMLEMDTNQPVVNGI